MGAVNHWWEALPAAWWIPEVRWHVIISVLLLMAISFALGYFIGTYRTK